MSPAKFFLITASIVFLSVSTGSAEENCTMAFYKESGHTAIKTFSAFDKVFMQCFCRQLPAGNYELTAVWHTPSGTIQRQDIHQFSLPLQSGYKASFWMKLLQKAPFQELASNKSFEDKYYGRWIVQLYLRDENLASASFNIQ